MLLLADPMDVGAWNFNIETSHDEFELSPNCEGFRDDTCRDAFTLRHYGDDRETQQQWEMEGEWFTNQMSVL